MIQLNNVCWGFIGCGEVTEKKSGPAFNMIDGSKVVAVMSRDEEKVKSYARRHNIPRWYTDAQELIGDRMSMLLYCHSSFFARYICYYGDESRQACLYRKADGRKL